MFEIGLKCGVRKIYPSKLSLKVSSAVTIDTIAMLLLASMYVPCGNESTTLVVPDYGIVWWLYFVGLSLDDTFIDHVLQTLFSEGIIISPERELQIVRDHWLLHWHKGECKRRCDDSLTPLCESFPMWGLNHQKKKIVGRRWKFWWVWQAWRWRPLLWQYWGHIMRHDTCFSFFVPEYKKHYCAALCEGLWKNSDNAALI